MVTRIRLNFTFRCIFPLLFYITSTVLSLLSGTNYFNYLNKFKVFYEVFKIEIIDRRSGVLYLARNIIHDMESFAFRLVSVTKRDVLIEKYLEYLSYMNTGYA